MASMTNAAIQRAEQPAKVTMADMGMLILRVALGVIFVGHGSQKLFGWFDGKGLFATLSGFEAMGIPLFFGYLAIFTEFFGGLAILFGVLSRLAGLGIAVTMIVAMFKVHLKNGFFLEHQGVEYNIALLAMAVCITLVGPGTLALGSRLRWLPFFLR